MVKTLWFVTLTLPALTAACAAARMDRTQPSPAAEPVIIITGTLAFRDGAMPPAGSVASVTLMAFPDSGENAPTIAATSLQLDGDEMMIPFELSVPEAELVAGARYAVRGTIRDGEGNKRWTTEIAQLIDPADKTSQVGVLMLARCTAKSAC